MVKKIHTDLSKVDISNDFRDFPQLYNSVEDIEKFIVDHQMVLPVLTNLLKLRADKQLDLTPTEEKFYFDSLFDYIYDVYRVPVEETYESMKEWLIYIEHELVIGGLNEVIKHACERIHTSYDNWLHVRESLEKFGVHRTKEIINCYRNIETPHPNYYIASKPTLIESFWIKSGKWAGQPEIVDGEAYMRVHVYADYVYIFGCDDCSYTLNTANEQESLDFATYLMTASPLWNFNHLPFIHPKLEFTN